MELKCIAIDDEPLALTLIKSYADRIPSLRLHYVFDDAVSGAEFLRANKVDLLFIDINMPDITGIELVRSLQTKPMVIFTTAHKKFAIDGFELDAIDYLLKPIAFDRFEKAVSKALEYFKFRQGPANSEPEFVFVRSGYQLIRINLSEIEYIESIEDYIRIHLANEKPVMTLMTLKAMLEKLPSGKFQRIHRSYVVPLDKIRSVMNKKVKLTATELPIGESYGEFLNEWKRK